MVDWNDRSDFPSEIRDRRATLQRQFDSRRLPGHSDYSLVIGSWTASHCVGMRRPRREPRPFFLGHRTQARLCAPITTACHHPRTTSSMRLYRARRRGGSAINVLRAAARQPLPGAPRSGKWVGFLGGRWRAFDGPEERPPGSGPTPHMGITCPGRHHHHALAGTPCRGSKRVRGSRTGGGLASAGVDALRPRRAAPSEASISARQLDRWEQLGALSDDG